MPKACLFKIAQGCAICWTRASAPGGGAPFSTSQPGTTPVRSYSMGWIWLGGRGFSDRNVRATLLPKHTAKQMRPGPATQAALFSWRFWLAVSRTKATDDRDTRTRKYTCPRYSPEAYAHRLLVQRFHPALEGGFRRRPLRPGSSSLAVNRISPGDSPSREPPATLNRTGKVQKHHTLFD
jgi:hypothetical protein